MAQWTMTDEAAGAPNYANNILNVTGPSTAIYENVTEDAFVTDVKVGVFGVSASEMAYANTGDTEADIVPHSGWVLRTEGTGGRAGRIQYEVLVASGSMTGDGADDTQLPE